MADISSALRSIIPISLFNRGMAGKVFECPPSGLEGRHEEQFP